MTEPTPDSGRIVYEAPEQTPHRCDRPEIWVMEPDEPAPASEPALRRLHYPGTVWECGCGRTWVAGLGEDWEPEGRFARWRRERRLSDVGNGARPRR